MNGFRVELLDKILGINGHIIVQPIESDLTDYDEVAKRISAVPGVKAAIPIIEGQALASGSRYRRLGRAYSRTSAGRIFSAWRRSPDSVEDGGGLIDFDNSGGVAIGTGLSGALGVAGRRQGDTDQSARGHNAFRHSASREVISGRCDLLDRDVGIRFYLRLHAAHGGAALFQQPEFGAGDRGLSQRPRPGAGDASRRWRRQPSDRSSPPTGTCATSRSSTR